MVKNNKAHRPTMTIKAEKCTDYVYKLSNGQELRFKDKNFPTNKKENGQLELLI